MSKKLSESKTVLFQLGMGLVDAVVLAPQVLDPYMTAQTAALVMIVLSVFHKTGNVYLRKITGEPIA